MQTKEAVQIGTTLILRIAFVLVAAWLVYLLRDIVFLVLAAMLTSMALRPAIIKLSRYGLSRSAAVIIVYAVIFLGGVGLLALFIPLLFSEVKDFLAAWPAYLNQLDTTLAAFQVYLEEFGIPFSREQFLVGADGTFGHWFGSLFSTTVDIARGLIHFIGYFFLSLYLSLEEKGLEKLFLILTPKAYHAQAISFVGRMQSRVSQWLFGQLVLMLIAFVIYYIGLSILGVPYALALALFGGLMEILPYIGPILAAIPAILAALFVSPLLAVLTLAFYTIAHQFEAHVLAPQVMRRASELNPLGFILAVLIGFELAGPIGIILAVPIAMIVSLYVDDLLEKKSSENV